jgi:hypothetical protein
MSTAAAALRVALAAASKRSVRSARETCPWHGAKFDIRTGAGRGPPAGPAVKSYPVRVTGADIEIEGCGRPSTWTISLERLADALEIGPTHAPTGYPAALAGATFYRP